MDLVATETITLIAEEFNLPAAREGIAAWARALELRVDAVDECPGRFSTEISVTLTGPSNQIEVFRDRLGGSGLSSSNHNPLDFLITIPLELGLEKLRRSRRARSEREPGV